MRCGRVSPRLAERPKEGKCDLARCADLVKRCFASKDYVEGRRAFMEKRKPAVTGA